MGKTSLATNIAFNCAEAHLQWQNDGGEFNYGAPTAFFSLEMSADQLRYTYSRRTGGNQLGKPAQRQAHA